MLQDVSVVVLLFALLLIALEVGFREGRRSQSQVDVGI
jgi:hypothetical protein